MLIVHMLHCTDVGITAMPHYSGVITGTCGWSADASHLTAPRVPVGGRVIRVIGNSGAGVPSRQQAAVIPEGAGPCQAPFAFQLENWGG